MMKNVVVLALLQLFIFSCAKEKIDASDTEKPQFVETRLNGNVITEDIEGELFADSTNTVEIVISDNVELSQINLNIHFADGEHNHTARITENDAFSFGPVIKNLSGKTSKVAFDFQIPKDVMTGEYHIETILLDKSGNQNAKVLTADLGI